MFAFLVEELGVLFFDLEVGSFVKVIIVKSALGRFFAQLRSSEQVNLFWMVCEVLHHKRNLFDCLFASILFILSLVDKNFHPSSISIYDTVSLCLCYHKCDRLQNFHFEVIFEDIKVEHVHKSFQCFKQLFFWSISKAIVLNHQNKLAFFHILEGSLNDPWNSDHRIVFSLV